MPASVLHRPGKPVFPRWTLLALPLALVACAASAPPPEVATPVPTAWHGPMPQGAVGPAAQLKAWWQRWDDPLLLSLLDSAQQASPTVAAAATRVAQARQAVVLAGAASGPQLNAGAGVGRAVAQVHTPPATQASLGLQASWELDLFGGQRAAASAADQRLQAAGAQWHEARVAVAAEVARQYTGWRACQQALALAQADAQARTTIARLTDDRARAGFEAPAQAALAQASAAQGRTAVVQQRAACDGALKALVALTALDESTLGRQLASKVSEKRAVHAGVSSAGGTFDLQNMPLPVLPPASLPLALPAQLLAQRPDVFAAQRAVAAASADVGSAEADRYPRLGLSGAITGIRTRGAGGDGSTWSVGPLQLSVPLFDAGRRAGQVKVQTAAYEEAVVAYRASVRNAVREVEQALVALHSTDAALPDARTAADGFARALQAATDRHRVGLGSLLELEDTRRSALAAELALAQLQRDRLLAWVDLYRALGGGWSATDADDPSGPATVSASHPMAFKGQP